MRRRIAAILVVLVGVSAFVAVGASAQDLVDLDDTFQHDLNFSPEQSAFAIENMMMIDLGDVQSFKFSDDPEGEPTLSAEEAPWLTPTHLGFNLVEWTAEMLPVIPADGQQANGDVWASLGGGPKAGVQYAVYSAGLAGGFPGLDEMMLFQNIAFPTSVHDREGLVSQAGFDGDNWQGGAIIPVLEYGPQPWSFSVYEVVDGSLLDIPDLTGFAYSGASTLVMAFEAEPVFGPPREAIPWIGVGFAGQSHDGRFGATPDSLSRVTAYPGDLGPRLASLPAVGLSSAYVIRPGFEPRVDPMSVWGVVDPDGEVWLNFHFAGRWGPGAPLDLFSLFFQFGVGFDSPPEMTTTGWSVHDGAVEVLNDSTSGSPPPKMFVMSDGSITASTGLNVADVPTGTDMLNVQIDTGFWPDELTTAAEFATTWLDLPLSDLVEDDPLTHSGLPVYDLSGGTAIAIDDYPDVDDTGDAGSGTASDDDVDDTGDAGLGTASDDDVDDTGDAGSGTASDDDDDGDSNTVFIVLIIGGLVIIIIGGRIYWKARPPGGYGPGIRAGLGGGDPGDGGVKGSEHDTSEDTSAEDTSTSADNTTTSNDDTSTREKERDDTATRSPYTDNLGDGERQTPDGTTYFGGRQDDKPKRDCKPLVDECRRLTAEADEAKRQAQEARGRADELARNCTDARKRLTDLEQRLADLEPRTEAPQYYLRIAELQIDIRRAESDRTQRCDEVEGAESEATNLEEVARRADEAARAACQAAADCEKSNG